MADTNSSNGDETVLRVGAGSNAPAVAAAIAHAIYDNKRVILRAIGAGAVNQAVKASAIAQGYVGQKGVTISLRPGFVTVQMPDGEVSAIILRVITS